MLKITKTISLLVLTLLPVCLPGFAIAQVDVNAVRNIAGQGNSLNNNVVFTMQASVDGSPVTSAGIGDTLSLTTVISPETDDIGKPVDVYIVDWVGNSVTMRDEDGNFVPWNLKITGLVPHLTGVTLEDGLEVEVFSGTLGKAGNHRVFMAFLVDGNTLYFTPSALKFEITEADTTEEAFALYESDIASGVVSLCVICHIDGGLADDGNAFHIFIPDTESNHLEYNFDIFQQLIEVRTRDFILAKVRGEEEHGGFTILLEDMDEYDALDRFLQLLE